MAVSPLTESRDSARHGRRIEPEILDDLPASDANAIRARRDLQRINSWMGNGRWLADAMQSLSHLPPAPTILEVGAGDGTLMLAMARRLRPRWPFAKVQFLDRRASVEPRTFAEFEALGWKADAVQAEVFAWLPEAASFDIVVANLFLHHFQDEALKAFFRVLTRKCNALLACEPRRFAFPRLAGGLVRLIGCGAVTCHDAAVSVAAGFAGTELTNLWPGESGWRLAEGRAGLLCHLFVASRVGESRPKNLTPGV